MATRHLRDRAEGVAEPHDRRVGRGGRAVRQRPGRSPTCNLENPRPAIDLDVVRGAARPLPPGLAVVVNAAGFGGYTTALAIVGDE